MNGRLAAGVLMFGSRPLEITKTRGLDEIVMPVAIYSVQLLPRQLVSRRFKSSRSVRSGELNELHNFDAAT